MPSLNLPVTTMEKASLDSYLANYAINRSFIFKKSLLLFREVVAYLNRKKPSPKLQHHSLQPNFAPGERKNSLQAAITQQAMECFGKVCLTSSNLNAPLLIISSGQRRWRSHSKDIGPSTVVQRMIKKHNRKQCIQLNDLLMSSLTYTSIWSRNSSRTSSLAA